MHGVLGHTTFEWLSSDAANHRTLLRGSLVERFLTLGVTVVAHDHPGHGRSSGLHGYVDSHDELRDCAVDVVRGVCAGQSWGGWRKVVMGMSMGGTVAIRVALAEPALVHAYALVSPAVRPPDDMFGAYGKFLRAISPVLGWSVPRLEVLKLPRSPDVRIAEAVERDGLMCRGALRVRMGMEFLRVYDEVYRRAGEVRFGRVGVFVGGRDNIVSPGGIEEFVRRVNSEDKRVYVYEELGHEVLREKGCERARDDLVAWVREGLNGLPSVQPKVEQGNEIPSMASPVHTSQPVEASLSTLASTACNGKPT